VPSQSVHTFYDCAYRETIVGRFKRAVSDVGSVKPASAINKNPTRQETFTEVSFEVY